MSHCRRGGSTRSGNEKGISEHSFLRQGAEIYSGGGRDTKAGSEKREKICMYVAETESGKWGKSVKAPSRSRSLSDGVKRSAPKRRWKRRFYSRQGNFPSGWTSHEKWSASFLLVAWSETITDCTETVDLLQISHFGAEQSVI